MALGIYTFFKSFDPEFRVVLSLISEARVDGSPPHVLDVGAGHGRYLKEFHNRNWPATGIEQNPELASRLRSAGLRALQPDALPAGERYDAILMSHIIEHFPPEQLVNFIDKYLHHLKPGGHLVIASPLMSPYFFDDIDHVRPYHPSSILMVWGREHAQVRFASRNALALMRLWYRRSPIQLSHCRALQVPGAGTFIARFAEIIFALLYLLSFKLISRKDGWVGSFKLELPPTTISAASSNHAL